MSPLLSESAVREFDQNGFVNTRGLLTAEEVARYGAAVDAAVSRRTASDTRSVVDKSTYEQSFVQCMRLWETDVAVQPLTFHPGLAQAAAELLAVPTVRLWQDQALYKEPGGRVTTAHQDSPFWPIGDVPLISAWIPFEPTSEASGATGYVPGSHKAGRLRVVDITHTTEPYEIAKDPALGGRKPVFVGAEPGDVVWHHGLTVHEARPNTTDRVRRVFTIVYFAEGWPRTDGWLCFPLDRDGVGVGELMEGPGMPVVWPTPAGGLPAPPPALGEPTGPQLHPQRQR